MEAPVPPSVFTDQVILWLVAFEGATVPLRVRLVPAVPLDGTPVISVTAAKAALMVMLKSLV
jgi:hypothetical protein